MGKRKEKYQSKPTEVKDNTEKSVTEWLIEKEDAIKLNEMYFIVHQKVLSEMIASGYKMLEEINLKKQELEIWRSTYNL